ncbi:venom allergen 5.01-like [Lycorma delicatula]|uniref:venom allergen 5.01-like n=1 Tax=Lycorma delicatula TaxID=130591 RepID=UPI003F510E51
MYLVLLFCLSILFSFTICVNDDAMFYTLIESGLYDNDIQIILDEHNKFRAEIVFGIGTDQPPAKNMRKMVWNNDLADLAQTWANTGRASHDPDLLEPKLGQNIARVTIEERMVSNRSNFREACKRWYDEKFNYTYDLVNEELQHAQPPVYHYVQVVSSHSYHVGCGYAVFKGPKTGITRKVHVCNYGPIGNIIDMYPYEKRVDDEPFCGKGLVDSDIEGLCDPNEENSIVPKYNLIQKSKPEQISQNIIQKNSYNPFDEDASFCNSLTPIIKKLNLKKNRAAKLEIVKLFFSMTFIDAANTHVQRNSKNTLNI